MMFSCKLYLTLEVEYSSINSVLRSPQATVLDPSVSSDLQVKSVSVLPCGLCTPPILYRLARLSYSNLNDPLPPQCDLWWSFWWSFLPILSRARLIQILTIRTLCLHRDFVSSPTQLIQILTGSQQEKLPDSLLCKRPAQKSHIFIFCKELRS